METADLPDPDLIIRTSGEFRLSNFLLLQAAYAEIFVSPLHWPDFGRDAFLRSTWQLCPPGTEVWKNQRANSATISTRLMILRTIATIILWGVLGFIVYGLKEPGAMWILNLCATLTLFEVYTILGRIGFAANRITGLVTGACMIPIAFYFPGAGIDASRLKKFFFICCLCGLSTGPARAVC